MKDLTLIWFILYGVSFCVGQKDFPELDHILPSASSDVQQKTVEDLILRKTPAWASNIVVKVDTSIGPKYKDTFKLESTSDGKLSITGTTGVAAAMAYYYYLREYCNCHISWAGDQLGLPTSMPKIAASGITITTPDRFRYYQNVCTVSYSFAWWNWTRWEQEIDWMAMSGINIPLAFNGQEAIWKRVYNRMGFNDSALDTHFGGPAFLSWTRMGNIHGWGGVLSDNWHTDQVALQHKMLDRMRSLGMIPIIPAFAGHVPENFRDVFPKANVSKLPHWGGGFNDTFCCTTLLEATDPMFTQIGKAFITEYIKEFGTDHLYNTDTFNELTPRSLDLGYLANASRAVFNGLTAGDTKAIWVMQNWLFQRPYWTPPRAKALLTAVPLGRMIVLDLQAELVPRYNTLSSYFGQPFIWNMLHNFGGTMQFYGMLPEINTGPFTGRNFPNSTMLGTGLTMEGINQNNVMYEFMNEHAFRNQTRDIAKWIANYALRRYGEPNTYAAKAWSLLGGGIYSCTKFYYDLEGDIFIIRRPGFGINPTIWYDIESVYQAWDQMLAAAPKLGKSQLFRYDYADVVRQSLQIISFHYYDNLQMYYNTKQHGSFRTSATHLLDLLLDLDMLLGSDPHFLLGKWIADARALGHTKEEADHYEYNARNQVTLWGPTGQNLDYANKQWSGLIKGYYYKRWELFILQLEQALVENVTFNQASFNADVNKYIEIPFPLEKNVYPSEPIGDTLEIAEKLHAKYRPLTKKYSKYFKSLQNKAHQNKKTNPLENRYTWHYDPTVFKFEKEVQSQYRPQRKFQRFNHKFNVL